ncbi:LOW QUALITY PROTEIN: dixin-like [Argopecten irradians]|uniref:LOW QUALITY PROTEIN: dixin-like n=1 Tax=Argopecten irradians TaxID=31199 RepID=UPI003716FC43
MMSEIQSLTVTGGNADIYRLRTSSPPKLDTFKSPKKLERFNNLSRKCSNSSDSSRKSTPSVKWKASVHQDVNKPATAPTMDDRLSPRVKTGVELSILRSSSEISDVKSTTLNYLKSRANSATTPVSVPGDGEVIPPPRSLPSSACPSPCITDIDSDATARSFPSSKKTRGSRTRAEPQKRQQLHAYVAWVNSQLKKKPGVRQVEDLRNDTKDGVVLAQLIEIVAGDKLPGIHMVPSNYGEMKENVEKVLHYMSSNRIRMHHASAKDIVEGNLKSTMRLILAIAAHFKPQSVKHSSQHLNRTNVGSPHAVGIAQGASAALAEARRTAAKAGNSFRGNRSRYNNSERRRTYHGGSSSDQYSDSDHSFGQTDHDFKGRRDDGDGASNDKSPLPSARYNPQHLPPNTQPCISKSRSSDYISTTKDSSSDSSNLTLVDQSREILAEYQGLSSTINKTRTDLLKLQDLLLSGEPPDGEESGGGESASSSLPEEQMIIMKSQLVQATEVCKDLREELSATKDECMQLQGTKAGLNQRLLEQEERITQLNSEVLRADFEYQRFESEITEMKRALRDKDKVIVDLKKDIARRDKHIDHLQNEVQLTVQEKENATRSLKMQISDLHDRLKVVGQTGATLSARVASQDKRMAQLEGKILSSSDDGSSHKSGDHPSFVRKNCVQAGTGDELQVVRDSLHNLRLSFKGTDPQQHTIDTLEQSVSTLLDKITMSANTSISGGGDSQIGLDVTSRRLNFDSTGDVRRSPITSIPGGHTTFPYNHLDGGGSPTSTPTSTKESTKVLYFTDKSLSPFSYTIRKRLGEITLKDFKAVYDRPGNYRYSFKALDPEFGTVKEEMTNDTDIIPGWEGKIVAWITEDTGT